MNKRCVACTDEQYEGCVKLLRDGFMLEGRRVKPNIRIISYDVVDCFVNKIICRENSEFLWILDFDQMNNLKPLERISPRYMHLLKAEVKDEDYDIFLEFELSFEECQEYMKTRGRRIVRRGWENPIKVKVALEKR